MRPLSTNLKTAFIFYLVYAGMVTLVTTWPPTKPAVSTGLASHRRVLGQGTHDLSELHNSFEQLWGEALSQHGWDRNQLQLDEETKLEAGKFGTVTIRWVSSKSKIILPETATEKELMELAGDWQRISESLDLVSMKLKWGYTKGYLWARFANQVKLTIPAGERILPIDQVTVLVSAGTDKGRWPGFIPRLPLQQVPKAPAEIKTFKPTRVVKNPKAAIIIDDVGSVKEAADAMFKVPARLTWAVLPFTPYAAEYIERAKEYGFEVILHLPLEPLDYHHNPGPGLIKREWRDDEIIKQFEADLSQVPGAVGINNHMGSAGTADARLMDLLMRKVKIKNLYFVDSMTSNLSVAEKYARSYRVKFKKRQVFIDNSPDLESKKAALRKLLKIALSKGEAIGIGHARDGTAEAIIEVLPEFEKAGVEIVPVSELIRLTESSQNN